MMAAGSTWLSRNPSGSVWPYMVRTPALYCVSTEVEVVPAR